MFELEFSLIDSDVRRWWTVAGDDRAVSVSADVIGPGEHGETIRPRAIELHWPGDKGCPVLAGGCEGCLPVDEMLSVPVNARGLLGEWKRAGHDDRVIRRRLEQTYAVQFRIPVMPS